MGQRYLSLNYFIWKTGGTCLERKGGNQEKVAKLTH